MYLTVTLTNQLGFVVMYRQNFNRVPFLVRVSFQILTTTGMAQIKNFCIEEIPIKCLQ